MITRQQHLSSFNECDAMKYNFGCDITCTLMVRPHLTTTVFFLSSCVNSYIGGNATHLRRHADNVKNLCLCCKVRTGPKGLFTLAIVWVITITIKFKTITRVLYQFCAILYTSCCHVMPCHANETLGVEPFIIAQCNRPQNNWCQ